MNRNGFIKYMSRGVSIWAQGYWNY